MVLFMHNRYRAAGGEERVVEDLMWLVRERLGEPAELLQRGPTAGRARAAAGLLLGGLEPREVADAVRLTGARVVHAHNINPTLGPRALKAARGAGARVVLHLHQYRLVCAVGACFTQGEECTRCRGRNTLPGLLRNCRGSRGEALAYAAGLALWQHRLVEQADAVVVPSVFARERLREIGAPLPWDRVYVVAPPVRALVEGGHDRPGTDDPERRTPRAEEGYAGGMPGGYALVVSRLAPEKGIGTAVEACRIAGIGLVVAGEGVDGATGPGGSSAGGYPEGAAVSYVGRVDDARLAELRSGAALAIVPSLSAETFGLAAAEAMAAGLPVAASRVGALPELVAEEGLAPPGDAAGLAAAIERLRGDPRAGERALKRVREVCAPDVVAERLAEVYGAATAPQDPGDDRPVVAVRGPAPVH
jgi:glycosyltransferase involved in cell wall biosynthesis